MRHSIWTLLVLLCLLLATEGLAQDSAIPPGTPMPGLDVELRTQDGETTSLGSLRGTIYTVVVFWSNKCPWTARYEDRIRNLYNDLTGKDKAILLINSNDAGAFPAESASASGEYASGRAFHMPYLKDAESRLAAAFGATRTPQAFVFDSAGTLVYSGALDDSPGDPDNVTKNYVRDAISAVSESGTVSVPETKAFGCTIRRVR